jgi:acyl-CoA reductase-like NAD-dependent aldehyde dehydrogenase
MTERLQIITPIDGSVYAELPFNTLEEAHSTVVKARKAQADWARRSVQERAKYCTKFVDAFLANTDQIAEELTWQMGRPLSQAPGEVRGFEERARFMISCAAQALNPLQVKGKDGFKRWIQRVPVGVVFNLPAWNYPYLTAVNAFIPALMAGNAVIMKHSSQTALCAQRIADAFVEADLPSDLFGVLNLTHAQTEKLIAESSIDFVCFTGSVQGGHAIQRAASHRFIGTGLELGGKDPAYVRADAHLNHAVETLVDGAMFNSGQSCCGIERIYVHEDVYDTFVEGFVTLASQYRLGDPRDANTNLGPMVRVSAANAVRRQIQEAVAQGAVMHLDEEHFTMSKSGSAYLAPQVLTQVNHNMAIMQEETFGPVVGIMPVKDDEQALHYMNDSRFGLTASIWTRDMHNAQLLATQIQTGTVFMNRCDYLDPALAWTGVKDSGRGCTLSQWGYESLTRPQSFHFKYSLDT